MSSSAEMEVSGGIGGKRGVTLESSRVQVLGIQDLVNREDERGQDVAGL